MRSRDVVSKEFFQPIVAHVRISTELANHSIRYCILTGGLVQAHGISGWIGEESFDRYHSALLLYFHNWSDISRVHKNAISFW